MSIFSWFGDLFRARDEALPAPPLKPEVRPEFVSSYGSHTGSGQRVSAETAKTMASAYRCGNIISDDIAAMPFQVFERVGRSIQRIQADAMTRNLAYLLEVQPNRWMTPFVFKKAAVQWLVFYGNAYLWQPVSQYREIFVLDASKTYPVFDEGGNLAYKTRFPNGEESVLPGVEMCHLMINSADGLVGKGVITYAKETMGRQMGAHVTQNMIHANGLNPSAVIFFNGELSEEARKKVKDSYTKAITGSENAGGVAVFDNKVTKFEPVSITPQDAQFLETIEATDAEIANFFGLPLYKLNMGKQSYQSNEQQNLDYLRTTLNPYLVQWEQAGRLSWLSYQEQGRGYLKFNRDSLLQTDAKTRAEYLEKRIFSGQITPNEAREVNDESAYVGGDEHYIPANMMKVGAQGVEPQI